MVTITINENKCIQCGQCILVCPFRLYGSVSNKKPQLMDPLVCVSCGHCIAICPTHAIQHECFPLGSLSAIDTRLLPDFMQVLHLMKIRRSVREFQRKTVEKNDIISIIHGSQYAPRMGNVRTTEVLVVQNADIINKLSSLTTKYLSQRIKLLQNPIIYPFLKLRDKKGAQSMSRWIDEINHLLAAAKNNDDLVLHHAPVLILLHAHKNHPCAEVNATLMIQNMFLLIQSLGYGGFYPGYLIVAANKSNRIQQLLSLPKDHQIVGGVVFGYPKIKFTTYIEQEKQRVQWI